MDNATLIRKALESRDIDVDLGDGRSVRVRRPPEGYFHRTVARADEPEVWLRTAVDWSGFTEASILGPAVGASDPLKFDLELWVVIALDHMEWIEKVGKAVASAMNAYREQQEATRKN